MASFSYLTLRWGIENASSVYAAGKAESSEFNEGGFKWRAGFKRVGDRAQFSLRCAVDHNEPWKCETEVNVWDIEFGVPRRSTLLCQSGRLTFNEKYTQWVNKSGGPTWETLTKPDFHFNGNAFLEFRLRSIISERNEPLAAAIPVVDPNMFAAPNNRSDVVLIIGKKKLHVSKEYLAVQSPVFAALFFGDYAEKRKKEIEIKDVVYEEMLDLMCIIYHRSVITDRTVSHILKLADRFQIESLLNLSETHLMNSKGFDAVKKLVMADQYRLHSLRNLCLKSFPNASELSTKLKLSPEFDNFSGEMKVAICERLMDLTL